jgi:hypothetical protein
MRSKSARLYRYTGVSKVRAHYQEVPRIKASSKAVETCGELGSNGTKVGEVCILFALCHSLRKQERMNVGKGVHE